MKRTPLILTIFLIAGLSISVLASDVSALTIYQGIMTLEVKGEREWISSFVGEYYGPDDHFRTTCRELIQITVPSFYISMGLVADQSRPSVVVASAEYKCFKNGNLVEYWDCPEQQVPPLHPLASYGAVVGAWYGAILCFIRPDSSCWRTRRIQRRLGKRTGYLLYS